MGVMAQAVQGGGADQAIGKAIAPFGEVQAAGDRGRAAFIALTDEFMEVFLLWGA